MDSELTRRRMLLKESLHLQRPLFASEVFGQMLHQSGKQVPLKDLVDLRPVVFEKVPGEIAPFAIQWRRHNYKDFVLSSDFILKTIGFDYVGDNVFWSDDLSSFNI